MKCLLLAAVGLCLAAPRVILARPQVCYTINECGTLAYGIEGCIVWHSDIDSTHTALIAPNLGYVPPARLWVQGTSCDCLNICMQAEDRCLQGPHTIEPCAPVSARRHTWGQLKILYRA